MDILRKGTRINTNGQMYGPPVRDADLYYGIVVGIDLERARYEIRWYANNVPNNALRWWSFDRIHEYLADGMYIAEYVEADHFTNEEDLFTFNIARA